MGLDRRLRALTAIFMASFATIVGAQATSPPLVAFVALASRDEVQVEALTRGLVENGLVPGQTVRLESRFADGSRERMRQSIVELTGAGARVFVAAGPNVARMIHEVAANSAVVVASLEVFETAGVAGTIPRPEGNVTGFATLSGELIAKRLELLREIMPGLKRVAAVSHAKNRNHPVLVAAIARAGQPLGIEVMTVEVTRPDEVAAGLAVAKAAGAGAALFMRDYLFETHREVLVEAANAAGLASSFDEAAFVALGGLMSYAPHRPDLFHRSATYVARLLAGAKPADLPIQQPTRFELVVNRKTALTLGLTLAPSILVRADEVIE